MARDVPESPGTIPHLSHSRIQKYVACPEQYRLHYIEGWRPKQEAAAKVFGGIMHMALAEYFRHSIDPVTTFRKEWSGCRSFELRYSKRDSWEKLNETGEKLLEKFFCEEAHKIQRVLAVESPFQLGLSNVPSPFIGILDLVAMVAGKCTLVEFKTGASDWDEYQVSISDQLTAYYLAEPTVEQAAICVLVKKKKPEITWHFTQRSPEQQIEYLQKTELIAGEIANQVFYKRVGFWCRQCDFLPLCTGKKAEQEQKLIRIQ